MIFYFWFLIDEIKIIILFYFASTIFIRKVRVDDSGISLADIRV